MIVLELPLSALPSFMLAVVSGIVLIVFGFRIGSRRLQRVTKDYRQLRALVLGVFTIVVCCNVLDVALRPPPEVTALVWTFSLLAPVLLFIVALNTRIPVVQSSGPRRTLLAVGAHPDDVELAAGGTIARMVNEGHRAHIVVLSGGALGAQGGQRPTEAQEAAAFLGAVSTTVHDFPDAMLTRVELELTRAVEQAIAKHQPDIILTHSAHDMHQDHVAVHRAVMRAARRHTSILCFESPSATREFYPSVFVDIDDYVEVKATAIAMHRDQADKPYMSASSVRGVATFRGHQARRPAAEGFEPVRMSLDLESFTR